MPEQIVHRAAIFAITSLFVALLAGSAAVAQLAPPANAGPSANTAITLSSGFCATVFADNLGHVPRYGGGAERRALRQLLERCLLS